MGRFCRSLVAPCGCMMLAIAAFWTAPYVFASETGRVLHPRKPDPDPASTLLVPSPFCAIRSEPLHSACLARNGGADASSGEGSAERKRIDNRCSG